MFEGAPTDFKPMTYTKIEPTDLTDRNLDPSMAMMHVVALSPGVRVVGVKNVGAWTEDGARVVNKQVLEPFAYTSLDMIVCCGWPNDPDVESRTREFLLREDTKDEVWFGRILDNPGAMHRNSSYDNRIYHANDAIRNCGSYVQVHYTGQTRLYGSSVNELAHCFDDLVHHGYTRYLLIPQNASYVWGQNEAIRYIEPWEPAVATVTAIDKTRSGVARAIVLDDDYNSPVNVEPYSPKLMRMMNDDSPTLVGSKVHVMRSTMPRQRRLHALGLVE